MNKDNVSPSWQSIIGLLNTLDITQAFKTKRIGDLRRWSAKRTVGGIIVMTACNEILEHDCSWQLVCLCAVGVLPLCLSFLENRQS